MALYSDSKYPVRADLDAVHAKQFNVLGNPGTWGSGAQRLAVVTEARRAGYEAGVLEEPDGGDPEPEVELPAVAKRAIQRLAVAPKDVDQAFYNELRAEGLGDAEYVEIVGLVSRMTDLDIFARGIGVPLRPLPSAKPGEPTRDRPAVAKQELAWVPTVPNAPEGGELADELYGGHPKPYIVRGVSLVPEEMKSHLEMEEVQYLPLHKILEADYQHHDGITRAQAEIVAGRVSAINECFY